MVSEFVLTMLTLVQDNLAGATRSLANDKVFAAQQSIDAAQEFLVVAFKSLEASEVKPRTTSTATGWYV